MMEASIKEQRGITRIAWDGVELHLWLAAGVGSVEVELDGVSFAKLAADGVAPRVLRFPFAPGGHTRMNLAFLLPNGLRTAPVGVELGRSGIAPATSVQPLCCLADFVLPNVLEHAEDLQREVAIIVPVYNAAELVRACLGSVLAHTTGKARLIVIDDASPDPAVALLLARYTGLPGVSVLRNEQNLGFTATVNRGMALAGRADVVLLNADAEVAAQWLTGLRGAAYGTEHTASATAVSDNAGAFSVPELERENPLPAMWTFAQTARALWQQAGSAYPTLPTGNGFCMYLRRAALDAVGDFDAQAFAEGYGEENDWSQRAEAAGWRHVIAGNVLVRHARSMSFGHERRASLGLRGMQILRERWPHYEAKVGASLYSFERRVLDWRVRRIYATAASHRPLPRVLFSATAMGSLNIYEELKYDAWRLREDPQGVQLEQYTGNAWRLRERADAPLIALAENADALSCLLACWLQSHAIEVIVEARLPNALLSWQPIAEPLGIALAHIEPELTLATALGAALAEKRSFIELPA